MSWVWPTEDRIQITSFGGACSTKCAKVLIFKYHWINIKLMATNRWKLERVKFAITKCVTFWIVEKCARITWIFLADFQAFPLLQNHKSCLLCIFLLWRLLQFHCSVCVFVLQIIFSSQIFPYLCWLWRYFFYFQTETRFVIVITFDQGLGIYTVFYEKL